jgi:hypothetical protein
MTQSLAIEIATALAAIGVCVDSLELLRVRRRVLDAFDWSILRTHYIGLVGHPRQRTFMNLVAPLALQPSLLVGRALAAAAALPFLLLGMNLEAATAAAIVFLAAAVIRVRLVYGLDGADQMQAVVWAGIFLFLVAPSDVARWAALVIIAGQLWLSYLIAGVAKAVSHEWRGGSAVTGVLSTLGYGSRLAARAAQPRLVALSLCWSVIVFELGAPGLIAAGTGVIFVAGAAIAFHSSIAMAMGLNNFVWAFCAALPPLVFVATNLYS